MLDFFVKPFENLAAGSFGVTNSGEEVQLGTVCSKIFKRFTRFCNLV